MTRSSTSHPLQIATLPIPTGEGTLGLTFCPGKCDPYAHNGPWARDLPLDLGAIRGWGAHALVTLLEDHEFDLLHVGRMGDSAEAAGLDWYHLPIPDMGEPGWQFERRWIYAGARLRRLLRRGGRVVLHCRAGLGRAGTIAARLLVELGVPPAEAVSLVRKARPGAIQTAEQEHHVHQARRVAPAQDEAISRRLGCLLGGALGDAFGYPVAFESLAAIQQRHGPAGLREPEFHKQQLEVSDDTQLTLFTLEGLTRAGHAGGITDRELLEQVRLAYLDWLECQGVSPADGSHPTRLLKHAALHARRSPAKSCIESLRAGAAGTPEKPANDSREAGVVLRAAAVACMPEMNAERAFRLAARAAALTHGHPAGFLSAGILAATLCGLLEGKPLQTALIHACDQARAWPSHAPVVRHLEAALEASVRHQGAVLPAALGAGRSGDEALAIGYYAVHRSTDFREVLAIAANQDGLSDIGAGIAGQLFAAQRGIEGLPQAWIRRLDVQDALFDLADWALPLWRRSAGARENE